MHILLMIVAVCLISCGTDESSRKDEAVCVDWPLIFYANNDFSECRAFSYSICGTQSERDQHQKDTDAEILQAQDEGFSKVVRNDKCPEDQKFNYDH